MDSLTELTIVWVAVIASMAVVGITALLVGEFRGRPDLREVSLEGGPLDGMIFSIGRDVTSLIISDPKNPGHSHAYSRQGEDPGVMTYHPPIWGRHTKDPSQCRMEHRHGDCGCGIGKCEKGLVF